jgi:hypothetical protein
MNFAAIIASLIAIVLLGANFGLQHKLNTERKEVLAIAAERDKSIADKATCIADLAKQNEAIAKFKAEASQREVELSNQLEVLAKRPSAKIENYKATAAGECPRAQQIIRESHRLLSQHPWAKQR